MTFCVKIVSGIDRQVHLLRPAFIRTIIINPHNPQLYESRYKMYLRNTNLYAHYLSHELALIQK